MAITTYAELQDAIIRWMIRDDDDMPAFARDFIALAEERFNNVLRLPEMEQTASATTVDGVILLPPDFVSAKAAYIDGEVKTPLTQLPIAQLTDFYASSARGSPLNFALQSGNVMVFGPAPDDEIDIVLNYYAKIPPLSDAAPTNWLLTTNSSLYLAASLAEGFAYTVDAERAAYWEGRTNRALDELRQEGIKNAYSGPLRAQARSMPSGRLAAL